MKRIPGTSLVLALAIFSIRADAIELICPLTGKVSATTGEQVSQEDMAKWQFELRIDDSSNPATLSRCSFSTSKNRVTCDNYNVDHIARDSLWIERDPENPSEGLRKAHITKYYVHRGQFDVQLYPDGLVIENNGRGSIAWGMCGI